MTDQQTETPHISTHISTESSSNGIIELANESRFQASNYSEALTAYTVGWKDPENLEQLLNFIAPSVPVGRRFEFKKSSNAEAFYSEFDDVRAIGSSFKRVEYTGESVNEKTLNKGLTIRVDHDEAIGDDWQERYVQLLMQRLYRNELRRALLALSESSESSEIKCTQDGSTCDPDAQIRQSLMDASNKSGIRPNKLLFGEIAWDLRANCFSAQNSAGSFKSSDLSPKDLAQKLFLDAVEISKSRYQTATSSKDSIVGKEIYAFFAQDAFTKDEPSNIKRFYTPVDGSNFRVYIEESAKYTDITVEHYSSIIVTNPLGLKKLTIS